MADLITVIEEWAISGVTIQVQHLPLTLDGACVSSNSFTVECEATEPTKMEDKSSTGVQSVYIIAAVIFYLSGSLCVSHNSFYYHCHSTKLQTLAKERI